MNIIEEHRSKVRAGENSYSIEVTALPGGDEPDRLIVSVSGAGPQGESVADGQPEVASTAAAALGSVLSETLRHHVAITEPGARRTRARPASQGRPWNPDLDGELERRWVEGQSVEEIAVHFERSPGGIRARLPRVGCDPERPGEYLPAPPSQRTEGDVPEEP
ncbi:helix-turn-helix domain containing protein [Amycolatopsis alkalitolerans]|uniref:Helix-turn-helix domain containing protein n=1 Tax=Amycolatopsis alkalitolerans TaxID=2547244 RepID=A0A5C4LPN9_9PSEU|nr:helix-turn-helix domain containing protein [Amycolatopsis alkalitolerans]TNC19839.1 helix-turn-helix domain containing protein [Amycolatopsis alkalitolerans]